jgi:hypothetical protein
MGEVYRAKDTTLGRDVAIKVLPQAVASEPDRVARFQHEAQALAALNHPAIASIYGFEQSGQVRALVMELVEGPTLAERMAAGPMPLEQAMEIGRQIAQSTWRCIRKRATSEISSRYGGPRQSEQKEALMPLTVTSSVIIETDEVPDDRRPGSVPALQERAEGYRRRAACRSSEADRTAPEGSRKESEQARAKAKGEVVCVLWSHRGEDLKDGANQVQ